MKENSTKKNSYNPFREFLDTDFFVKAKSGIVDFVSGVKNLFRHTGDDKKPEADVNNYLKTPEEIETELRSISSQKEETKAPELAATDPKEKEFSTTGNTQPAQNKPVIFRSLEEAMSGEMEENY